MKKKLLYILITLLLFSCKKEKGRDIDKVAEYSVTFNLNWNNIDFPTSYPSNAHFSPIIGWSHQSTSIFFSLGSIATEGVKKMAESGLTSPLDDEINVRIANEEGANLFVGNSLSSGVGTITINIKIDEEYSSVTLVSMLAPSPDWYVGVVNINLFDGVSFVESKTINLLMYDAGSDDGTTFVSSNSITSPQSPITLLVDTPLGNGTAIAPHIGTVTFEKQ